MAKKYPDEIFEAEYDGVRYFAQYIGRQRGFECMVCGEGENCFTFNVSGDAESLKNGNYETFGFGASHIDAFKVIE